MADVTTGMEASAIGILKRAVELDTSQRFTESLVCYQEGIQLLLDVMKGIKDESKKLNYRKRITEYMERAEKLKSHVEKEKEDGKYHEQIHLEDNSTGWGYEKIFKRFLEPSITYVEVEDPYIRNTHQVYNFVRFCEMLVKSMCQVKKICLLTGTDQGQEAQQSQRFQELASNLRSYNIVLEVSFSPTLHDRTIRFNNGWIIKIGRGLDIYKAPQGKFIIGSSDYDLRPCHETSIDIFHTKHTKSGDAVS